MQYVPFGKTGLAVSEVSFGAMQVNCQPGFKGAEEGDEPLAIRAVQTAVGDCGVNFIDTARGYKRSEEIVGRALADMNGGRDVHIATKVGNHADEQKIRDSVETSLKNLRRDCVDLMQIHSGGDRAKREATLEVLQMLRDEGKFRLIGVTLGFGTSAERETLHCVESGAYDAVQVHVNALHPMMARRALPAAHAAGMGTLAMNPQCGGYLSKRCPNPGQYDLGFLADLGITNLHEAALKWCISLDCLDAPIPGSKRPEHIRANCGVSDGRHMTPEQMRQFEDMLAGTIDTTDDWNPD